jgi:hypothetical protein
MRLALVVLLNIIAVWGMASKARAGSVLLPGETLQAVYSTVGITCPGACDTFVFYPQEVGSFFSPTSITQIYVSGALLGTDTETCCIGYFHSPTSEFIEGTTISFTTIDLGSTVTVDMSIVAGSITWTGNPDPELFIGTGTCGGCANGTNLTAISAQIIAPEPAAFWLTLLSLSALGLYRYTRLRVCGS